MVYNPVAGKLVRRPHLLPKTEEALRRQVGELRLAPTTGPNTAGSVARAAIAGGADLVLVAGGDGTLNEVINGIAELGGTVPVMMLPGGTANVFCMETGVGSRMVRAASRLSQLVTVEVPLAKMTSPGMPPRYFLLMAGAGIDAAIVERVNPQIKRKLGKVAYWIGGFSLLGQDLPLFAVSANGRTVHASFALASRVRNYGGDLTIARHANLLRPELAVVLFEGSSSFRYIKYFSGVLLNRLKGMSGVHVFSTRSLSITPIEGTPVVTQLDGEATGPVPVTLEVGEERLKMLLPPDFVRRATSELG